MSSNKMWGGRFDAGPAAIMGEITPSIDFDKRLAGEDLAGSKAHVRMLATEGIISKDDGQLILKGLEQIEQEIAAGSFVFKRELEDIHLNIEARLGEIIGPAAGRLHTARRSGAAGAAAGAVRAGRKTCRDGDAGLHPYAGGAAGDLWPSHAGLCRNVRPRPWPV